MAKKPNLSQTRIETAKMFSMSYLMVLISWVVRGPGVGNFYCRDLGYQVLVMLGNLYDKTLNEGLNGVSLKLLISKILAQK